MYRERDVCIIIIVITIHTYIYIYIYIYIQGQARRGLLPRRTQAEARAGERGSGRHYHTI